MVALRPTIRALCVTIALINSLLIILGLMTSPERGEETARAQADERMQGAKNGRNAPGTAIAALCRNSGSRCHGPDI